MADPPPSALLRTPNQLRRPRPQPANPYDEPPPALLLEGSSPSSLLLVLDALDADQAESGRWRRRFGRGVSGPKPVWRGSSSGNAKSRILTDDLRVCCCGVGVVGLGAPVLALVVESALESGSGPGSCGFADVTGVELGRERVEEQRESAPEARREAAGEGGAGREEVSELREDLRPSRGDDLAGSVGAV